MITTEITISCQMPGCTMSISRKVGPRQNRDDVARDLIAEAIDWGWFMQSHRLNACDYCPACNDPASIKARLAPPAEEK